MGCQAGSKLAQRLGDTVKLKLAPALILRLAALAILMLVTLPALAQSATPTFAPTATYRPPGTSGQGSRDCGSGLPCGPIPWNLPAYPILASPTPMPTFFASATPSPTFTLSPTVSPTNFTPSPTFTPTGTPTATHTPTTTATATALFDTGPLNDALATAGVVMNSTPIGIEVSGTPITIVQLVTTAAPDVENLFGRFKGIIQADWGDFQPVMAAFAFTIALMLAVGAFSIGLPILKFIVAVVFKIYTAVTDLIPF